jgi:transcriptional regulator with XRE-family HTH domain
MRRSAWAQEHHDRLADDPEYLAAGIMIELSEQIVRRMEELGISQHELARRIGKKQPFISRLLNHGTNMTIRTLAALAIALDADIIPPRLVGRELAFDAQKERKRFLDSQDKPIRRAGRQVHGR